MSHVIADIYVYSDNRLCYDDITIRCALGKSGVTNDKREGDMKTPLGTIPLRHLMLRPDRINLTTPPILPYIYVTPDMGWCDDIKDEYYNQPVPHPYPGSHEALWREDHRYDIIIPLGYNDNPPIAGKGSAIFFHLASDHYDGTEGCVAISREDMLALLPHVTTETLMHIIQA